MSIVLRFLALPVLIAITACGGDEVEGGGASGPASGATGRDTPVEIRVQRVEGEAVAGLRQALEFGDLRDIEARFDAALPGLDVEGALLSARLWTLRGNDVEATTRIEAARAEAPDDPRVYATAAELNAASGRLETAREELRRGVDLCGMCPELLRAQGIIELCRQGGAARGLDLIDWALEHDPDLPFVDRPRGQGHLLLAKAALSQGKKRAALQEVRLALSFDPEDADTKLFLVDALGANGDFPNAVLVLEELNAAGADRRSELALMYKRAGLAELVLSHREAALEYFVKARSAGLEDDELGSAATMLREEAELAMEAGVAAFEQRHLVQAREHFERALHFDDSLLVVHSQLAVVLFNQREFLPAATHWRRVLDEALENDIVLPDPIHIFLSKALFGAGETDAARSVLTAYVEREPEGRWADDTRALIADIDE